MAPCPDTLEEHFFGMVTVGERGQVVIPAEARRRLNVQTGDKLLVMHHPASQGVLLCRSDAFRDFISKFIEGLDKFEQQQTSSSEE